MANSLATSITEDGSRNTIIKVLGTLDTSDISATTILNPASQFIDPIGNATTQYRIDDVWYSISPQLGVRLLWDASTDVIALNLFGSDHMILGWNYGGVQNNAGSGKTGIIQLSTTGYASGTQGFTLFMKCVKQ